MGAIVVLFFFDIFYRSSTFFRYPEFERICVDALDEMVGWILKGCARNIESANIRSGRGSPKPCHAILYVPQSRRSMRR